MKILVTGGVGFIGSNFVRYMLSKYPKYKIVVLDALTYAGNLNNLRDVRKNPRFNFVLGNICDKEIVNKAMKSCDSVVHFAAETHVDRSIADPMPFVKTDVLGTGVVLDAALRHNIKRFVHVSTDEVYGSINRGSFKETDALAPRNPYSATKAAADLLAQAFFTTHRLPVMITRSSNNYGAFQHPEKLIPKLITNALRDVHLPIYGDGKHIRDWLYVLDNCEAIDLVLHSGTAGEAYNVGGKAEQPNIEIARRILKVLNKPNSLIKFVADRPGHDRRYSLDCKKISRALGWKPKTNLKEGIEQTVDWYKKNSEWWSSLV